MDSRSVSLSKALSWRIVAWSITAMVSYGIVGNGESALILGTLDSLVKIGAYYGHERMWLSTAQRLFTNGHAGSTEPGDGSFGQRRVSFFKALSWRLIAFAITVVVSVIVTRDMTAALTLGALDSLIKIVIYYVHERTWVKILSARTDAQRRPASVEQ